MGKRRIVCYNGLMVSEFEVALFDRHLRVGLRQGATADFHYRWLRNACDQDRHPVTRERTVCSSELPDVLEVDRAFVAENALHVVWRHDARESVFDLGWLEEHAYARDRDVVERPPSDVSRYEVTGVSLDEQIDAAHRAVLDRGAGIVRALPGADPEAETERIVARLVAGGLRVIETHFGRIEDLRTDNTTNANTDQLGYTDAKIDLHTDQPFLDEPPRFQVLQSIRAAEAGGESALVDAERAAAYLASQDVEAYEILRSTPVTFHRKQQKFERVVRAPILGEDGRGGFRVRFSYFTLAPHDLPFERMEPFYRAYDRFARLVRDPRHQLRFLLGPGDFVIYDNHRMLHARTAFTGARWVRGVYFDAAAP